MSTVDPHGYLAHVHPDLVKVIEAAWAAAPTFQVVYGLRSNAAEQQAVRTGHSTTMHSRHLADANYGGKACAVDIAALIDGQLSWAAGREARVFTPIADQIKAAAFIAKVPVEWGGDWQRFKDWGHFQLPWAQYP